GVSAMVLSGSATSEGGLMRSPNGRWLCFGGYNTNVGGTSVASTTSATVPRAVGRVDAAAGFTLAASTTSQFSGNNIRSAATDGTNSFWAAGANSGTYYLGFANSAVAIQTSVQPNTRINQIQNGNLYFSTGSGTHGIYGFNGMPTTAASTNFVLATGASPY